MKLEKIIEQRIQALSDQIPKSGKIYHYSSDTIKISQDRTRSTTFFPSIIGLILSEYNILPKKQKHIDSFLIENMSSTHTWNYWDKSSSEYTTSPLPDDMDDTSNAAAFILDKNPSMSGEIFGHLVHILADLEEKEGGPYQTWITPKSQRHTWEDIDVVVNANIGYVLQKVGVSLDPLNDFLTQHIKTGDISSKYYPSNIHSAYFISRFLQKTHLQDAKTNLIAILDKQKPRNLLEKCMLATSYLRLDPIHSEIKKHIDIILDEVKKNNENIYAFCIDPYIQGKPQYAGSKVLIEALQLETLLLYKSSLQKSKKETKDPPIFSQIKHEVSRFYESGDPIIAKISFGVLKKLSSKHTRNASMLFPYTFSKALRLSSEAQSFILPLCVAHTFGWLAFTLYDDVIDGDGELIHIPAANISLQQVYKIYGALPLDASFRQFFFNTMKVIDEANAWEIQNAHQKDYSSMTDMKSLDFGDLSQLSNKSKGHILGPLALLHLSGYEVGSHEFSKIEKVLSSYCIVRQLLDDAHDWENDLNAGHISVVANMLLRDMRKFQKKETTQNISYLFWKETVPKLLKILQSYIATSIEIIHDEKVISRKKPLLELFLKQKSVVDTMEKERKSALEFIETSKERLQKEEKMPSENKQLHLE